MIVMPIKVWSLAFWIAVALTVIIAVVMVKWVIATKRLINKYKRHIEKTLELDEVKQFLEEEPKATAVVVESPLKDRVKILWISRRGVVGVSVLMDAKTMEVIKVVVH
jgi:hypothetical protein